MLHWGVDSHQLKRVNGGTGLILQVEWPFFKHAVTCTFEVIDRLKSGEDALAAKQAGIMSHYIVDLAVFGHVMGSSTDWGSEAHHSDYENYVRDRTTGYVSSEFDPYLEFDGDLVELDAYDGALDVAFVSTFGDGGDVRSCVWMDVNYDWSDGVFRDGAGASLNLAVNVLADVLHGVGRRRLDLPQQARYRVLWRMRTGTLWRVQWFD